MSRAQDLFDNIKNKEEEYIDELIASRGSEDLFLDFKRSSDNGSGNILSQNDRNNLAKAISGFGNSEGGVIIWGIECKRDSSGADLPNNKFPLMDAKRFLSQLEGSISGLTLPPHNKIENHAITIGKGTEGFVATYIPQNPVAPIQAVFNNQFYVRAGSNFVQASYQVLAAMFGKKPQPRVYHMYTMGPAERVGNKINVKVGVLIHNEGPGIARDVFVNAKIMSFPGGNSEFSFETPDRQNWVGNFAFGRFLNLISTDNIKIPPDASLQPIVLHGTFAPPFDQDLKIEITVGCEGAPSMKGILFNKKETLKSVYEKYIDVEWAGKMPHEIVEALLNRDNDSE